MRKEIRSLIRPASKQPKRKLQIADKDNLIKGLQEQIANLQQKATQGPAATGASTAGAALGDGTAQRAIPTTHFRELHNPTKMPKWGLSAAGSAKKGGFWIKMMIFIGKGRKCNGWWRKSNAWRREFCRWTRQFCGWTGQFCVRTRNSASGRDNSTAGPENSAAGRDNSAAAGDNSTAGRDNSATAGDNFTAGRDNSAAGFSPPTLENSPPMPERSPPTWEILTLGMGTAGGGLGVVLLNWESRPEICAAGASGRDLGYKNSPVRVRTVRAMAVKKASDFCPDAHGVRKELF